jgi:hypothetical protein
MASKDHRTLDTFHMIKHDPSCLELPTRLHPFHQVTSTTVSTHKHFEEENFLSELLSWKTTILNVIITTIGLES